jgi:2-hydroxychromene-2-carboxylate isomerase
MTPIVEYWFDIVCPYAYLGSTQIDGVAERTGARVVWKPFLLGGVLAAVNGKGEMPAMSGPRLRHNLLDMHRWAEHFGVTLAMPHDHPRKTVLALRALLAGGEPSFEPAAKSLFDAYWVRNEDVEDPAVVARALDRAGLDGAACVERASDAAIKADLRARTDEAIARGVFGAPTMFVGGDLFWGQDRFAFVEKALRRATDSRAQARP